MRVYVQSLLPQGANITVRVTAIDSLGALGAGGHNAGPIVVMPCPPADLAPRGSEVGCMKSGHCVYLSGLFVTPVSNSSMEREAEG